MRVFTRMHLDAARAMPRKAPPLWFGEKADRQYRRRARRERKLIARWYRIARADPEVDSVRTCHRYQVVATAAEARLRLKHYNQ